MKTSATSSWNGVKSNLTKGLDQLVKAIDEGLCTSGQLDLMMPDHLSHNFDDWLSRAQQILSSPPYSNYNITINIGSFID